MKLYDLFKNNPLVQYKIVQKQMRWAVVAWWPVAQE